MEDIISLKQNRTEPTIASNGGKEIQQPIQLRHTLSAIRCFWDCEIHSTTYHICCQTMGLNLNYSNTILHSVVFRQNVMTTLSLDCCGTMDYDRKLGIAEQV